MKITEIQKDTNKWLSQDITSPVGKIIFAIILLFCATLFMGAMLK